MTEMERLINEEGLAGTVDLIVCDLPYGVTRNSWDKRLPFDKLWERIDILTKNNAAVCLFGQEPFSSYMRMSNIKNYRYDWIFRKSVVTGYQNANKMPMREHEVISVFYRSLPTYNPQGLRPAVNVKKNRATAQSENYGLIKGGEYYKEFTNYPKSIIGGFGVPNHYHPTEKPVPLIEYLIKTYSNEGETVLDMTMGAGGAAIACRNLNRNFIGIELEEKYYNIAKQRLNGEI